MSMTTAVAPAPGFDPLHRPGAPSEHWSTDNVGEAMPGVLSPLGASIWDTVANNMLGGVAYALGVFSAAERDQPHRYFRLFYGRGALQVEFMAIVGDRMPGTTGKEAVEGLFGRAPESINWQPTRRRYPFIAAKLPTVFIGSPRAIQAMAPDVDSWWRTQIRRLPELSLAESQVLFAEASARFDKALTLQSVGLLGCIQPLYEMLAGLIAKTGVGEIGVLSGSGGAEMAIVADLWGVSRGRLTIADVVANHGFHGPREGDVCARVWREDPSPLERLVSDYAAQNDDADPLARGRRAEAARAAMQQQLAAAFPPTQRPLIEPLLRLAASRIPLRGVAKRCFLQSLDVGRGAARRAGEHLAAAGLLDDPEDVFMLVDSELIGTLPPNARELVAERRAHRAEYQALQIPSNWKGTPAATPIEPPDGPGRGPRAGTAEPVTGLGVSAGVIEGIVKVVTDPAFEDVEPGEILVSATTDPSWSSIMFVSAALVVDIGSALSHAAVVARELGLPCVVNTRDGSRRLQTGDRVRVDGGRGIVEVLVPRGSTPDS
jgi:phosphohistidine swiveling domain-containing protein